MFLLIILLHLHHRVFVVFVMMGGSGGGDSIAIGIQGPVLVDSDMGIVAPLHYCVVDRCWRRRFFKEQGHRGQICMQVMIRRSSSGGRGAGGKRSTTSGAGRCGHGECTEREERCEKNTCAERHFVSMKFVKEGCNDSNSNKYRKIWIQGDLMCK